MRKIVEGDHVRIGGRDHEIPRIARFGAQGRRRRIDQVAQEFRRCALGSALLAVEDQHRKRSLAPERREQPGDHEPPVRFVSDVDKASQL